MNEQVETIVMTKEELNKNYVSVKMYELAKAFHDEKCAEYTKLCYNYNKLESRLEQVEKEMVDKFEKAMKEAIDEISCFGWIGELPTSYWNGLVDEVIKQLGAVKE